MYLEYEYVGTVDDLEVILNDTIKRFIKVRHKIPEEIRVYLPNETDFSQIIEDINEAIRNCVQLIKKLTKPKINLDHLAIGLKYINGTLLKSFEQALQMRVGKKQVSTLLKLDAKLLALNRMVDQLIQSQGGFATLRKRHQNYEDVMKVVQFITVQNVTQVESRMKKLGNILSMTNAAVIQSLRHDSLFMRTLSFPFNFVRYFFDSDQAQIMVSNYLRKPQAELMQKMWNVGETECIVTTGMKCMFQRVNTVKKVYIPRRSIQPDAQVDIFTKDQNKIQLRIISPHPIQLYGRTQCCGCLCCTGCPCCIASVSDINPNYQTIMIHIHGGGFIALSSFSMQSHTRRWSNTLGIPVFSIDYRLSPQSTFPDALDDCWYVYQFLTKYAYKYMNIMPKKIILSGDSAGGNLVLSLNALLMKKKFSPLPHGIYLAYPATDFRQRFSPSRINSMDDTLLFITLLFICRTAYLGQSSDKDPLVSPLLLTEGWVSGGDDSRWPLNWPKTRMMVGENDPLFDDSIQLLERMVMSNIDVKCKVFEGMGHGLLSLEAMVPQCGITITHSFTQLKELLE